MVPSVQQLQEALITAEQLPPNWVAPGAVEEWTDTPGTQGGVIEPCAAASEASRAAAMGVDFQVGTTLNGVDAASGPVGVYVHEYLLAGDPGAVKEAFDALRAGADACYGQPLVPEEDYGTIEFLALPAVGEDRYGEYHTMPADQPGSGLHLRMAVVRDGPVLMLVKTVESVGSKEAEPTVSDADMGAIVEAAVARLP